MTLWFLEGGSIEPLSPMQRLGLVVPYYAQSWEGAALMFTGNGSHSIASRQWSNKGRISINYAPSSYQDDFIVQ
jgi:hypothetical protein